MMSDRRTYERYIVWFPVTLALPAGEVSGICRDVSSGGMLVACPTPVAFEVPVTCRFRLSLEAAEDVVAAGHTLRSAQRDEDDMELAFPHRVAVVFEAPRADVEALLQAAQARLLEGRESVV